ncbi:DUF4232 domain-containing protein [Streptomyces sp. NBC_00564]|uniref:DUF4232 domain-containing protein n=1 Tax=Streptomyces sp. NBC_00564 TaxID=2903663 RepID=UPI00352FA261|nr:DUF4232 domain-containing protein [Streptomyces sp. NBC_00564]
MRAIPIAVTALVAALTLTACSDGGGSDGGGSDTKATASATDAAAAATACEIGQVGLEVGPASEAPAAGDTGIVPFTITNSGDQCTLEGFPVIDLNAGESSATVAGDEAAQPEKLTLAKDDTATFTITYVRGDAADAKSLDAKTVKISLPGATTTKDFPWSYGPVAGKTEASDPDASVSPFQHAGD